MKRFFFCAFLMLVFSVPAFALSVGQSGDDLPGEWRVIVDDPDAAASVFGLPVGLSADQIVINADRVLLNDAGDQLRSVSPDQKGPYTISVTGGPISTIFIPFEYLKGSFYVDNNGYLRGMRSSSFTLVAGSYSVRFPAFSTPEYRLSSGSGYTWTAQELRLDSVDSGVEVKGFSYSFDPLFWAVVVVGLGVTLCLLMRR